MDPNFGIKRSVVSIRCPSVVVKAAAACVEREEKRPRGVLIPLYITDRGRARLAVHVQLQLCKPGIWVRPLLIPLDSGTGRIHAAVLNGGVVVLFVKHNKHLTPPTDANSGSPPPDPRPPCVQLVRSLAFPSLQPSLVRTFSLFPIISCTNRKRDTESGPPAEINIPFPRAKTQREYHRDDVAP